jgi:hypothetical protein
MRTLIGATIVAGVVAVELVAFIPSAAAQVPSALVAVVEPHARGSQPGDLDFSVALGERKLTNTNTLLDGLARPGGARLTLQSQPLAILVHHEVPVGTLAEVVVFATKAGYSADNIAVFLFDAERRSMMQVTPSLRNAPFSTDPDVISGYVKRE